MEWYRRGTLVSALCLALMGVATCVYADDASAKTADSASAQSLQTGVQMIYNQLKSTLAEAGLEEIDARGKVFDPNFHEAVSQQESSEVPEGHVTQQIRKGYKYRNRLIRPAGVVVAKKSGSLKS